MKGNKVVVTNVPSTFSKGLQDIVATESSICFIDGKNSKLIYRGYEIHDLAENATFEETAYLLLFGDLPTKAQLQEFEEKLTSQREIPKELIAQLKTFPKNIHPMAALRTAISLLSFYDPQVDEKSIDSNREKAIRLIAKTPVLVAYFDRLRRGESLETPKTQASWSTARNFLYLLRGKEASDTEVKVLDKYFILLAEHDLNASTFTAMITTSTQSDIYSFAAAAVGTLKGDLHGSANSRAMESLIEIGEIENVESYVENALSKKKKLMGFGHRVYKGPDPRAKDLREMAHALAEDNPEQAKWFAISEKLEKLVYEKKKLNCNVDFYSASVLYTLGIPVDLFTPMFAISRMTGWTAHVLEQVENNRLIRPISHYLGHSPRTYNPIQDRK